MCIAVTILALSLISVQTVSITPGFVAQKMEMASRTQAVSLIITALPNASRTLTASVLLALALMTKGTASRKVHVLLAMLGRIMTRVVLVSLRSEKKNIDSIKR